MAMAMAITLTILHNSLAVCTQKSIFTTTARAIVIISRDASQLHNRLTRSLEEVFSVCALQKWLTEMTDENTLDDRTSYADTSTSSTSTVYITDIIEEGNRFGVSKAGSFHAISENPIMY